MKQDKKFTILDNSTGSAMRATDATESGDASSNGGQTATSYVVVTDAAGEPVERADIVERNPRGRLQPRLEAVDDFAVGHSFFQRVASRTDRAVESHRPGRQIESLEIGDRPPGSQRVGQSAVVAAGRGQHDGVARDGLAEV